MCVCTGVKGDVDFVNFMDDAGQAYGLYFASPENADQMTTIVDNIKQEVGSVFFSHIYNLHIYTSLIRRQ